MSATTSEQQRLSPITSLPNLFATRTAYPVPDNTVVQTKAFLIQRSDGGNVWMYASPHVAEYTDHIQELGGVTRQLINHRDEVGPQCTILEAPVFCHADEQEANEAKGCVVHETYDTKVHTFGDDLVAYHCPGHTNGVTCYLWTCQDNGTKVLFTGDTLYSNEQEELTHADLERHAYLGNRQDLIRSFELLLELDPAFVVAVLSNDGRFVNRFDREKVSAFIEELKKGG